MKANDLLDALVRKLDTNSQQELAEALGVSVQMLVNWKQRDKDLSPHQVAAALAKSRAAAVSSSQRKTIRPLAEFYEINCSEKVRGEGWQVMDGGSKDTLYAQGLRAALEKNKGIYIFYDSQGKSLYVGKTKRQTLWKEINLAFNRVRDIQKISLVWHPTRNQEFKPGYEMLRQPRPTQLELCDMAAYFSAYSVDAGMIEELEALMVRGFANDLLNVRMETFAESRKKKGS
jgi:transcriptional regulator with XRE-family HTH domain